MGVTRAQMGNTGQDCVFSASNRRRHETDETRGRLCVRHRSLRRAESEGRWGRRQRVTVSEAVVGEIISRDGARGANLDGITEGRSRAVHLQRSQPRGVFVFISMFQIAAAAAAVAAIVVAVGAGVFIQ